MNQPASVDGEAMIAEAASASLPKKARRGRPPIPVLSPHDLEQIKTMASMGLPIKLMASLLSTQARPLKVSDFERMMGEDRYGCLTCARQGAAFGSYVTRKRLSELIQDGSLAAIQYFEKTAAAWYDDDGKAANFLTMVEGADNRITAAHGRMEEGENAGLQGNQKVMVYLPDNGRDGAPIDIEATELPPIPQDWESEFDEDVSANLEDLEAEDFD